MARTARKLSRLLFAAFLVAIGVPMLVLPGPGLVTIAVGLGIAGRELRWAWVLKTERRILGLVRRGLRSLRPLDPRIS